MNVPPSGRGAAWRFAFAVLAVVALGLALRLFGLGERVLSHPENFAPGLDMPSWVHFPPPRHDLISVLKGTLIDGHPPTYFVALLAWTKAFGASLFSLRLPSALLGALSIWLVYRVALREGRRWTALLAALLVALNGFHIYWSQLARMYVPVSCLCLLSTLFLLRLREHGRRGDQLAYLASTALALWSHLYAWPLVFAQIVATTVLAIRERRAPTALRTQILAVAAGLPTMQLALFQNPPSRWHEPISEYFAFGYLEYSRVPFFGETPATWLAAPLLIAMGVLLLACGLPRREAALERLQGAAAPSSRRALEWLLALVVTAALAGFATYTLGWRRAPPLQMWFPVALPLISVLLLPWIERRAAALCERPPAWLARAALDVPLSLTLAILPILCMAAVSMARGAYIARGTIVFAPFLAIAVARGLANLGRVRPLGLLASAALLALHIESIGYFAQAQSTPMDYRALAQAIEADLQPSDLILVKNDFSHPPLFYYLRDHDRQLVHEGYPEAVRAAPGSPRIWLVHLADLPVHPRMLEAVQGLDSLRTIQVSGARATLYAGTPQRPPGE